MVIVEAAGGGLVGSDIGGIPESAEEDGTGLLFSPGESAALAAIVCRASAAFIGDARCCR